MKKGDLVFRALGICLFVVLCINMLVALFGVLPVTAVNSTDEACYGINAYEMIRNNNIWVNTLKYNPDYYNSKPPLMLWLIMIGYKIYGYNAMGLRVASAVCGFILYILVSFWLYKVRDGFTAVLFAAFLPACTLLFNFHMMRSGDTDSLYVLCFTIAMMGLIMALRSPRWLLLYGVAFGLAFMTKSTHAALIIIIGLLCLPYLVRAGIKFKHIIMSAFGAIVMILPWFIKRMSYDGLEFVKVMVLGETLSYAQGNVQKSDFIETFAYVMQLYREPVCDIAGIIIVIAIVVRYIDWVRTSVDNKKRSISFIHELINYRRYVLIVWFLVVVGAFSVVRARLEWYIYPAYIPLMMAAAECGAYLVKMLYHGGKKAVAIGLILVMVVPSIMISVNNIREYPWNGTGGNPIVNFSIDIEELKNNKEITTSNKNAFIENSYNDYKPYGEWELDCVFYCETILDMRCVDGGVEGFLATDDMDAILFLDKTLWDQYSGVLTGYVILQDNNFLIFSKHKYGE